MLLGHLGAVLAARPAAPKAPLGVLLVASEGLDLVCVGLVAVGVEHLQWTRPSALQAAPRRPAPIRGRMGC
jgi:hypothetical protein